MIGDIGSGLAAAFAEYLGTERERSRKAEDQQLDEQMQMIKALADRPDANPALLGRALTDLSALQAAKGSKRKMKKGMAGFTGATELPISQLLQGLQSGLTPMMGNTTESVPMPTLPHRPAIGVATPSPAMSPDAPAIVPPGYEAVQEGFTGDSILGAPPIPVPPPAMPVPAEAKKLTKAGQDLQAWQAAGGASQRRPVANQPMLRSPEERAREAGEAEAQQYAGRRRGQRTADIEALTELGASPEQIRAAMLKEIQGSTPRPLGLQTQNWIGADGVPFTVLLNPDPSSPTRYFGEDNLPFDPAKMVGARRIGIGPTVQRNIVTDDFGNVSIIESDPYGINDPTRIATPPGVRGRTSPDGPVVLVQGPNGFPVPSRLPRQGTDLSPTTVPAPPAPGQAPGGGRVPAVGYRPETQGILNEINSADGGIQLIDILAQSFDPRYTGIVQGRWNSWNQKYNPFAEADPNFRNFEMNWSTVRNELMRINAGLTQTESERAAIELQLVTLNDKDENFASGLNTVKSHFQRKLDTMKRNAGVGIPFAGQGTGQGQSLVPPPPPAIPGRGVQYRNKRTGEVEWINDPAFAGWLDRNPEFEKVR